MQPQQPTDRSRVFRLLVWHLELPVVNLLDDVVRGLAVDCAADRLCGAKNLLRAVREGLRERFRPHGARNFDNLVEGDVAGVLDVLLLLAIAWGLC